MKMFALALLLNAAVSVILLNAAPASAASPNRGEHFVNPHITFKPDPPKADENLEISIEWPFFQGDSAEITIDFDPVGSDVTITIPRGQSGVIAIPKGATKVTAKDNSGQCNSKTAGVE